MNGLTLFYSHYTDTIEDEIHSFTITPGLLPVAFLQNIQKTYLGLPYTKCVQTYSTNSYDRDGSKPIYKPNQCHYEEMMKKILHYCDCYPGYIGCKIVLQFSKQYITVCILRRYKGIGEYNES